MRKLHGLLMMFVACNSFAETREIAITIDDLPLVASQMNTPANQQRATERFGKIVQALVENNVPATGFVIAGSIGKGQLAFLEEFKNAGFMIGSHTYSHYNLNQMSADKYIADIARADKILQPLFSEPKYFRYPYLAEGNKSTKPKVAEYLVENHYKIAPVTIDSKDFQFNEQLYRIPYREREKNLSKLKARYLDYMWKATLRAEKNANGRPVKQILLIHANLLNSYALPDIIQMYKEKGYKFISLTEALENPAPEIIAPVSDKDKEASLEKALHFLMSQVITAINVQYS